MLFSILKILHVISLYIFPEGDTQAVNILDLYLSIILLLN